MNESNGQNTFRAWDYSWYLLSSLIVLMLAVPLLLFMIVARVVDLLTAGRKASR